MPFDLSEVLRERHGENSRLHARYVNPQMARLLKTIGFDRDYVRGEGCYLFDAEAGATSTSSPVSESSPSVATIRP